MAKKAKKKPAKSRKLDPVIVEIVRNGVLAVTEEMKTNLMRTAYNMIIYEALDFTTGLFTPAGETVSIGIGLPTFIRGMAETVKAKIKHFGGIKNMHPGDIYVTNDSYTTGSHLNHFTFTLPIFHKGKLAGFSCCMAHWLDVGGVLGGMTTDIYSEGIQVPILKYQDRGKVNQDLLDIIRMNVRLPERGMGDLRAQVTAVKTGERRFLELLDRYGHDNVMRSIAEIMDRAEAAARARTLTIPDGVYEAESWLDDDGVDIGKRIPVRIKVTVKGEEMTVDLTDVAKQVRGFYNSGISTGYGCAQVAYKCITSPTDYPINDGAFRSLKVIIPPGRIVSATRPAPMRLWMCFPMTIIDTIFKALQQAVPDRTIAGHHADLVAPSFHGLNPKNHRVLHRHVRPARRRLGRQEDRGRRLGHGLPERRRHPQRPERAGRGEVSDHDRALRAHSGFRRRRPASRRARHRAHHAGAQPDDGEQPERPLEVPAVGPRRRRRRHRQQHRVPPSAANGRPISPTPRCWWRSSRPRTPGASAPAAAAATARPFERPVEDVREDVRQGYVSVQAAAEKYGVVIDGETFEVDRSATDKLRAGHQETTNG